MTLDLQFSIPEDTLNRHKYIVGNIGDDLLFFAAAKRTETYHKYIVQRIKKTHPEFEPLGGGSVYISPGFMHICESSMDYGGMFYEILEHFSDKIADAYKERFPDVSKDIFFGDIDGVRPAISKKSWRPFAEKLGIKV